MAGKKNDQSKNRLELIPPEVISAIGAGLTYGANKYNDDNWREGISYRRVYGALQRHLQAFWSGENIDSESGLPHLYHAACNLTFLITFESHFKQYSRLDDRYRYE